MKIVSKYPTCSQCQFFDPSFRSVHYSSSFGLCRNPSKAYRDYLGDGSSASVQPVVRQDEIACGRYQPLGQLALPMQQDDNLIRRMLEG